MVDREEINDYGDKKELVYNYIEMDKRVAYKAGTSEFLARHSVKRNILNNITDIDLVNIDSEMMRSIVL